jgi:galactokinase
VTAVPLPEAASCFAAAGLEGADLESRIQLVARVATAFAAIVGSRPDGAWFVPGRLEVLGKHTDYAGGRSLVAAVPLGIVAMARARQDGVVRVTDVRTAETATIHGESMVVSSSPWVRYTEAVVRRLDADFPGVPLGIDIVFASDLPPAAGLSSSSALIVAIASALIDRADLLAHPQWQAVITTPIDLAGYLAAVESGMAFGPLAGGGGVGTHGGSEDHTAILTSQSGRLIAFQYAPTRSVGGAPVPSEWAFVIATSGVVAEKTGAAQARYNDAAALARTLLALANAGARASWPTLSAALTASPELVVALQARLAREADGPRLLRRLHHFIAEDARIMPALAAFAVADHRAVSELAAGSQRDADVLLGNQIDETRELARLAVASGAFAASSFGAGFGGSVWALVDTHEAASLTRAWLAAYRRAFPSAVVTSFITRGGPGLLQLPVC